MSAKDNMETLEEVRARRRAKARGETVPERPRRRPRKPLGQDIDGKPRPKRVLFFAAIALLAIGFGYAMGAVFEALLSDPAEEPAVTEPREQTEIRPRPWYETQPDPPTLVEEPAAPLAAEPSGAAPILPDEPLEPVEPVEGGVAPAKPAIDPVELLNRPRAYEEALPETVYRIPDESVLPPPSLAPAPKPDEPAVAQSPSQTAEAATWQKRALPFVPKPDQPLIAVVIDDMGLDMKRTRGILDLPGPLTVAYLTYADNLRAQTKGAWGKGHEVIAHVSMEPMSEMVDPGPNVLMTNQDPATIKSRLVTGLDGGEGFVGINNHMGSKFTQNPEVMALVMEVLAERGLLFLDSRTSGATAGPAIARAYGVPYLVRNVFLDNDNEKDKVLANLAKTEDLARDQGFAIAIGHPRSATIQALTDWLPSLETKGLQLVPLSAVMVHRLAARQAAAAKVSKNNGLQ